MFFLHFVANYSPFHIFLTHTVKHQRSKLSKTKSNNCTAFNCHLKSLGQRLSTAEGGETITFGRNPHTQQRTATRGKRADGEGETLKIEIMGIVSGCTNFIILIEFSTIVTKILQILFIFTTLNYETLFFDGHIKTMFCTM